MCVVPGAVSWARDIGECVGRNRRGAGLSGSVVAAGEQSFSGADL